MLVGNNPIYTKLNHPSDLPQGLLVSEGPFKTHGEGTKPEEPETEGKAPSRTVPSGPLSLAVQALNGQMSQALNRAMG